MYKGALIPPSPITPMNNPCPIHNGQGGPSVEIVRPRPIINAPDITVQRVPTRSAIWPIRMPPTPEPSQASALASAGIERAPPASVAMSLSATAMIQAAPNAIIMMRSATEATIQESLVSIEEGDCSMDLCPLHKSLADRGRLDHCAELRSAAQIGRRRQLASVTLHQAACDQRPAVDQHEEDQLEGQGDHDGWQHHHAHRHQHRGHHE